MSNATLRSTIVAEEGYVLMAIDASQIELRVLAILSQDPQMLEDLKTGDLHQATAVRMYGYIEDELKREQRRYDAKQGNFATVYGANAFKLAYMLECTEEEAEEFMQDHKDTYPMMYAWMDEKRKQAIEDGFVTNMFGRIRPIPELASTSWKVKEKAEREVVNTIVQGTAVDIIKLMMLYLRGIIDVAVRLVLQVHDEIVFEVPVSLVKQVLGAYQTLETKFPDYPCSIEMGSNYGELKKVEL